MIRTLSGAFVALTLSLLLAGGTGAQPNDPPPKKPVSGPWDASGSFKFDGDEKDEKKKRQALSGIACPANTSGQRRCLAVFDEGGEARYLVIGDDGFIAEKERVVLLAGKVELDAEGAASDGRFYYVTGSHSAKRKDCASNPDSRHVIRFEIDPKTGRALNHPPCDPKAGRCDTDNLWKVMEKVPGLKDHVGERMCLGTEPPKEAKHLVGKRGVNIEGLAVKDGRLYFGFRGPVIDGTAKILAVDADALFAGTDPNPRLSDVAVGKGRAIRDLRAVTDGILVLAGPDDDKANENVDWIVARWNDQRTTPLARLDLRKVKLRSCDKELKPEALAVVDDTPGQPYRVVIFSDGMCDGGPLAFEIPR